MGDLGKDISAIIAAIIAVAVLGVVLSSKANTSNVLTSLFGGVSSLLGTAMSPITGQTSTAASNLLNLNQGNTALPGATGGTSYIDNGTF